MEKIGNGEIRIKIVLLAGIDKYIVAYAPSLKIYGIGKTQTSAEKDLEGALETFINFHTGKKNLDQKLISLGWERKTIGAKLTPPKQRYNVPLDIFSNKTKIGFGEMPFSFTLRNKPKSITKAGRQRAANA